MKNFLEIKLFNDDILTNNYYHIKYELKDEVYNFKIDDVNTYISKNNFIRENNEFKLDLNIKDKKCTYLLKEKELLFDIDVYFVEINFNKNKIVLKYKISTDEGLFKAEIIREDENNE